MIYTGKDMAAAFRTVRKNTIAVAKDIPADKYGYRATPDTRTVGETLAHIAGNTRWVHHLHGVDKMTFVTREYFYEHIGHANAYADTLKTQDQILKALEQDGEFFAKWLETLSDAAMSEVVGFPPPLDPPKKTRFEMLLGVKEHEMHHRAQLMLIERMLGIVPHLTRARLAR
jgi:uncharacterized damage-inducible protein DinB